MKSYVCVDQHVCEVCGKVHDVCLLIDKRMHERFDGPTVTGWGLCPEHKKLFDDGYIALVAIDEGLSIRQPDGTVLPGDAHRTGPVAHLRRRVAEKVFNVPLPEGLPVCFVEPAVIDKLRGMMPA